MVVSLTEVRMSGRMALSIQERHLLVSSNHQSLMSPYRICLHVDLLSLREKDAVSSQKEQMSSSTEHGQGHAHMMYIVLYKK